MITASVVDNLLTMGYDAVTVSSDTVYTYLRERYKLNIKEADHTLAVPLPTLDQAASDAIRQAQFDGALQGGMFGAGGIGTIPMDVMALISASVRLTQKIAITYGFGVRTVEEKAAVWTVLGEASGVKDEDKLASVSQLLMGSMPGMLQTSPYNRVLMFKLVKEILLQLVWKEGQQGLRRLFPFAGTIIGATSNYRFLGNLGQVARTHYHDAQVRKRETLPPAVEEREEVARMDEEGNSDPEVQTEQHRDDE